MASSLHKRLRNDDRDDHDITVEPSDSQPSDPERAGNVEPGEKNTTDSVWPRKMTSLEFAQYLKAATESRGFDIPQGLGLVPGSIVPMNLREQNRKLLTSLSEKALVEYNAKENATFQFVELVKANHQAVAGRMYYITFRAKEDDQNLQVFRAKVWKKINEQGPVVQFCEKM